MNNVDIKDLVDGFFSPYGGQGIKKMTTIGVLRVSNDDGYIIMEKKCTGCGEWLDYDTKFWTPNYVRRKVISVGLRQPCKGCSATANTRYKKERNK